MPLTDTIVEAITFLEERRETTLEDLERDRELLGSILWHLYMSVQASIDLALKVTAKLQLETPESYAQAFTILGRAGLIATSLADKMKKMARFRHILAHAYTRIDRSVILKIIRENLGDIREYLHQLDANLKKHGINLTEI